MPLQTRIYRNFALLVSALCSAASCLAADRTLWYQQPANNSKPMDEALAIGNGRMGGLIFGAPQRERISINEDSLWLGGLNPSGADGTMGSYQVFGNVYVNLPGHTNTSDYRRDLDLSTALAHVSYQSGGVKYTREFFSTPPAGLLVARFTADKPHSYSGSVEMQDSHGADTTLAWYRMVVSGT